MYSIISFWMQQKPKTLQVYWSWSSSAHGGYTHLPESRKQINMFFWEKRCKVGGVYPAPVQSFDIDPVVLWMGERKLSTFKGSLTHSFSSLRWVVSTGAASVWCWHWPWEIHPPVSIWKLSISQGFYSTFWRKGRVFGTQKKRWICCKARWNANLRVSLLQVAWTEG